VRARLHASHATHAQRASIAWCDMTPSKQQRSPCEQANTGWGSLTQHACCCSVSMRAPLYDQNQFLMRPAMLVLPS
jgi:hypothetical protein